MKQFVTGLITCALLAAPFVMASPAGAETLRRNGARTATITAQGAPADARISKATITVKKGRKTVARNRTSYRARKGTYTVTSTTTYVTAPTTTTGPDRRIQLPATVVRGADTRVTLPDTQVTLPDTYQQLPDRVVELPELVVKRPVTYWGDRTRTCVITSVMLDVSKWSWQAVYNQFNPSYPNYIVSGPTAGAWTYECTATVNNRWDDKGEDITRTWSGHHATTWNVAHHTMGGTTVSAKDRATFIANSGKYVADPALNDDVRSAWHGPFGDDVPTVDRYEFAGYETVPGEVITIPGEVITIPGGTTTIPGEMVTVPGEWITVPGETITRPGHTHTISSTRTVRVR